MEPNYGIPQPQFQSPPMAQMNYQPQQQPQFQYQQPPLENMWQGAATHLMMDPNALQSLGQHAFESGQQYLDKNTWTRSSLRSEVTGQVEGYRPPRHDLNAPDLYIPAMSFVTYVILVGFTMGTEKKFKPEVLTLAASTALFFTIIEVIYLRLGIYLLNVSMQEYQIGLADLVAYTSYQYVSVIVLQMIKLGLKDTWIPTLISVYLYISLGWFSLRSLRYLVFPSSESANNIANPKSVPMRKTRVYFLFSFVAIQVAIAAFAL